MKPVRERTIYRALHCVIEYRYGSPYSYPTATEAEARRDTIALIQRSIRLAEPAYAMVNNRSEGNAPTTIQGLTEML